MPQNYRSLNMMSIMIRAFCSDNTAIWRYAFMRQRTARVNWLLASSIWDWSLCSSLGLQFATLLQSHPHKKRLLPEIWKTTSIIRNFDINAGLCSWDTTNFWLDGICRTKQMLDMLCCTWLRHSLGYPVCSTMVTLLIYKGHLSKDTSLIRPGLAASTINHLNPPSHQRTPF